MDNHLRTISKPLLIDLQSYQEGRAVVNGCVVSDSYEPSSDNGIHGKYRIIIESPIIRGEKDLSIALNKSHSLATIITLVFKCILGEAINTDARFIDLFTKKVLDNGEMPDAWTSNYERVRDYLDRKKE